MRVGGVKRNQKSNSRERARSDRGETKSFGRSEGKGQDDLTPRESCTREWVAAALECAGGWCVGWRLEKLFQPERDRHFENRPNKKHVGQLEGDEIDSDGDTAKGKPTATAAGRPKHTPSRASCVRAACSTTLYLESQRLAE